MGDVAITEVMANPLDEGEGEFIEIYNRTNKSIDVADWTIGEIGSTDTITTWDLGNEGGVVTDSPVIKDTTSIPSGAYAVFLDPQYALTAGEAYSFPAGTILLTPAAGLTVGGGLIDGDVPNVVLYDKSSVVISSWTHCTDTSQGESNSVQAIRYDELDSADDFTEPGGSTPGETNIGYVNGEIVDNIEPAAISNLTALTGVTPGTVNLKWTAPGDDGTGNYNVVQYLIKHASFAITSTNFNNSNISTYTEASNWQPADFGMEENRVISDLSYGTTYWFAIKAKDNYGNWSSWPDLVKYDSGNASTNAAYAKPKTDFIPPAAISNLTALTGTGKGTVKLKWTAPGDDGTGTSNVTNYILKYATFQVTPSNFYNSDITTYTPANTWTPAAFGTEETGKVVSGLSYGTTYFFAVKAVDEQANWSYWSTTTYNKDGNSVYAANEPPHVVISEVAMDHTPDFVELYNPTDSPIDISYWILDTEGDPTADATLGKATIAARGFYSIGDSECDYNEPIDVFNDDRWVRLKKADGTVVDIVGWGAAAVYEGTPCANPANDASLERKAKYSSTSSSMTTGGIDEFEGNGYDSHNNLNDFVERAVPQLQGTLSGLEPDLSAPSAISDLTALTGSSEEGEITFKWTAPGDEGAVGASESYSIKCSSLTNIGANNFASSKDLSQFSTSPSTSPLSGGTTQVMIITGLSPGVTYWFAMKAIDEGGNSGFWSTTTVNTANYAIAYDTAPSIPAGITALPDHQQITLNWTAVSESDRDFYRLYRDTHSNWSEQSVATETVNPNYTDTGLTNNVTYYYRVTAVDNGPLVLESTYSYTVSTYPYLGIPPAPANFDGVAVSTYGIHWTWNDNSAAEDGFIIYSSTGGVMVSSDTLFADTTFYAQTGLSANTSSYYWGVAAANSSGESSSSTVVTHIYTEARKPLSLTVDSKSYDSVTLSWQDNNNPDYTNWGLSYSTANDFSVNITTFVSYSDGLTALSETASNLDSQTTYYFRSWAYNENELKTDFSNIPSTKTIAAPGETPGDVLISEIYPSAIVTDFDGEWVELYNTTNEDIVISNWYLNYSTTSGAMETIAAGTIPAHGYYLIADNGFNSSQDSSTVWGYYIVADDDTNELDLSNLDHGVALWSMEDVRIDAIGWGTPDIGEPYEGTAITDAVEEGKSFERYSDDSSHNTYGG
ncbi:MAG: lamin tail domain-containing protein, partial [Elusimicrobia bacterium]|nr:lamin tail domain-containing protein [Elusimicrobiota bacterium]